MRKSCDLCYRKRIKCNGELPRCSQCVLYKSECTHDTPSRPVRKRRKVAATERAQDSGPAGKTTTSFPAGEDQHPVPKPPSSGPPPVSSLYKAANDLEVLVLGKSSSSATTPQQTTMPASSPHGAMDLPAPERVVREAVERYLQGLNALLPLYDPVDLSRLVDQWYASPGQRTSEQWAALNTVMALSYYHVAPKEVPVSQIGWDVQVCVANAQSVLTRIVMGELSLLNVQIVLGLVMLFQGSIDLRPALILMSTALRLAHTLGLHRRDHYIHLENPAEAPQRNRVFWIAYVLDRDIALRSRQAPIQQDADMDLEYPSQPLGLGGPDAGASFDVFLAHIELAHVQGLVYSNLFSVGAANMTPAEAAKAKQVTRQLLTDWKSRIPASLQGADSVLSLAQQDRLVTGTVLPRVLCTLYARAFTCLGQLSGVNSMEFAWIERLLAHVRSTGLGWPSAPPAKPQGWDDMVQECRAFMPLFLGIERKDAAFVWSNMCPFSSGLLILLANTFLVMNDPQDEPLIQGATAFINSIVREADHLCALKRALTNYEELIWHRSLLTDEAQLIDV